MENSTKIQIVEALASYNEAGNQAIDTAYEIYSENGGTMEYTEFYNQLDIRELDDIDFMYDSESETWATDDDMIVWYNTNI